MAAKVWVSTGFYNLNDMYIPNLSVIRTGKNVIRP